MVSSNLSPLNITSREKMKEQHNQIMDELKYKAIKNSVKFEDFKKYLSSIQEKEEKDIIKIIIQEESKAKKENKSFFDYLTEKMSKSSETGNNLGPRGITYLPIYKGMSEIQSTQPYTGITGGQKKSKKRLKNRKNKRTHHNKNKRTTNRKMNKNSTRKRAKSAKHRKSRKH
jgi:hypothetical protein